MEVGVVGGTGPAGRALGARLAAAGAAVVIGSRSAERGEQAAAELRGRWAGRGLEVSGGTNVEAAEAEIVVLATPHEGVAETAAGLEKPLAGKVVVSMVNGLQRVGGELEAVLPARGSFAATVQAVLPRSSVTAAFHHLPARRLGDLDRPLDSDVLVCADSSDSAKRTAELVETMPGLRAVWAGSLAAAGPVEALTAALVNVNMRYRSHVALRLEGLRLEGRGA